MHETLRLDPRVIIEALDQHAIVSIADVSGNIIYANDKFCQVSKYLRDELIGQNHRLLNSGFHDAKFFDDMWMTISNGRTWQGEICNRSKDGGQYWVETTIVPNLDENGLPYQYVSLRTVVTQIKEAEYRLARMNAELETRVKERTAELHHLTGMMYESEQRFRQLSENIHEVFWLTDPAKNKMLYVSPAYEAIWGRTVQSLYASPQDWLEAIHGEDRQRVLEDLMTKQAAGLYDIEYRVVRSNGDERWIHDKAFPVRDSEGAVYRIAGVAEDITKRKQMEADLQRAREMLHRNVLVGEVHHRIKNNLQGVAALLQQQAKESPETAAALDKAIARVRSIAVAYGLRGEADSQAALCDTVRAICLDLQALTPLQLVLDLMPHHVPVFLAETEKVPIALIVNELLFNAIKHTGREQADRKIHIQMQGSKHEMCFIIHSEHGQLPQDFDFIKGRGLGTGLNLVKSLLPPAGAHLSIVNAGRGVRTELKLTLPVLSYH